jgi:hypothetical protein
MKIKCPKCGSIDTYSFKCLHDDCAVLHIGCNNCKRGQYAQLTRERLLGNKK